jgi:hypothetical protein
MNQCYPKVPYILALIILILYLPGQVNAQCTCSDGSAALTKVETHSEYFPNNIPTGFNVPQFSPALGTLVCVNARIYLTSVIRFRLENNANIPVSYTIRYVRFDTLSGPGISPEVSGLVMKNYGPYPLAASDGVTGSGPDIIVTPKDTVYNNVLYQATTSNVAPYLGTGNVTFYYSSGVPTYAVGNDHYTLELAPINYLNFQLTYSYCPNAVLASNIKNFNAALVDDNNVSLKWTSLNESKNSIYEIQVSHDGKQFKSAGTTRAQSVDGASAKYAYQYHVDKSDNRKLYFRVRQSTGAAYSEIKSVNLLSEPVNKMSVYPNPVIRNLMLDFEAPVSGDYQVSFTNQVGQVVYSAKIKMNNSNTMQVLINDPPAPGVYYMRATNIASNQSQTAKVVFAR